MIAIFKCNRCVYRYTDICNDDGQPCCEFFPDGIPDEICSGNKIPEFNCNNDIGYIDILEQRHTEK